MPFLSNREYVDAMQDGRLYTSHFRKVPGLASTALWWADVGMAAGNPPPNYYASDPLVAATLDKWKGLFHGDDKDPSEEYLVEMMLTTPTANMVGVYRLMDYLLYYPFVDLDDTDSQSMDNTTTLPRYADGAGVRVMLVAQSPTTGAGTFTFTYVNQDGVEHTSPTNYLTTTGAGMGQLITTENATGNMGPFLILAEGDTGVRSIVSFTVIVPNGGLGALVLVKPLADMVISEINTPAELTFPNMRPGPPRVLDGAFLSFICCPAGSIAAGLLTGRLVFGWTPT